MSAPTTSAEATRRVRAHLVRAGIWREAKFPGHIRSRKIPWNAERWAGHWRTTVITLGPDVADIAAALRDLPGVADIDVIRLSDQRKDRGGVLRSQVRVIWATEVAR